MTGRGQQDPPSPTGACSGSGAWNTRIAAVWACSAYRPISSNFWLPLLPRHHLVPQRHKKGFGAGCVLYAISYLYSNCSLALSGAAQHDAVGVLVLLWQPCEALHAPGDDSLGPLHPMRCWRLRCAQMQARPWAKIPKQGLRGREHSRHGSTPSSGQTPLCAAGPKRWERSTHLARPSEPSPPSTCALPSQYKRPCAATAEMPLELPPALRARTRPARASRRCGRRRKSGGFRFC